MCQLLDMTRNRVAISLAPDTVRTITATANPNIRRRTKWPRRPHRSIRRRLRLTVAPKLCAPAKERALGEGTLSSIFMCSMLWAFSQLKLAQNLLPSNRIFRAMLGNPTNLDVFWNGILIKYNVFSMFYLLSYVKTNSKADSIAFRFCTYLFLFANRVASRTQNGPKSI